MKIGLVIYGNLETLTGGYLYDRMLVDYLRSQGDDVAIYSLPWRNYTRHLLDNFSQRFMRSLTKAQVDLLLQDELNHPSLLRLNRSLKSRVGFPIVSIVHHLRSSESRPGWQNSMYRLIEKNYLARMDGFVFNSVTTRNTVEALIGKGNRGVVAFPGREGVKPDITREAMESRAAKPGPLRILFVGSLIPRKELHTLIAALVRLPRDSWRLDVVGSPEALPSYAKRVTAQIKKLGIDEQVLLLGPLTGQELQACYARSHLLAVPSSYEGFGIVYLEAMGFGLPALASTAGAAHEIITHGRNGFLVQPGDAEAIASHIEELINDRKKLSQMGLAALERYSSHPTWAEAAATIRRFLEKMVH
ncbi:MAG: glycosyltransferase family 4 protein [Desulfomonilaceae bacterium]